MLKTVNSGTSPLVSLYTFQQVVVSGRVCSPEPEPLTLWQEGYIPHPIFRTLLPSFLFCGDLLVPEDNVEYREHQECHDEYYADSSRDLRIEHPAEQCQHEDRCTYGETDDRSDKTNGGRPHAIIPWRPSSHSVSWLPHDRGRRPSCTMIWPLQHSS